MKIGFYQFAPEFGKRRENLKAVADAVANVSLDLLVLPELFNTGYLFTAKQDLVELAEPVPGPTTLFLQEITARKQMFIVHGIAERHHDKFYNSAVLLGPDGVRAVYRKAHLFLEEKLYFAPGDTPFTVHQVGNAKIGILVCFDYWFTEAVRQLALQGAQIICHPSNLVLPGYGQQVTRVRAMENRIFWALCNRTGKDVREGRELSFTGESQIVSPQGEILARANQEETRLQIVEIEPKAADDKRITPMNDLFKDRRTDLYSDTQNKSP
jgi:predicted amidohydrolase